MDPLRSAEEDRKSQEIESGSYTRSSKVECEGTYLPDCKADDNVPQYAETEENRKSRLGQVEPGKMTGWPYYVLMTSTTLAATLIAFNATALGTATPAITAEFNTVNDVGWYSSAYLIANCVMVPFVGKLYKTFRIKVVFVTFIIVFELGSLIAGLSTSSMMLIIARAVTGIGGSGVLNGASTIVAATVPIAKRSFLNGIVLGCFAIGQAAGPLIGGALTQWITWRWCFYINLPVGGVVVLLFIFVVKLPVTRLSEQRTSLLERVLDIDFVGFFAFAAASVMFLIGLQWGGTEYPWNSAVVIGLLCGGVVSYVAVGCWFVYKGDSALLPPRMLRDRINIMISITSFVQSGATINSLYWLPVWFQAIRGVDALHSGVMLLPLIFSQLFGSVICGAIVQKTGYYLPEIVTGNALVAIGAGLTSTFSPTTSLGKIIGYQIFMGFGRGLVLQLLVTAIQANVPKEDASIATAYAMFCQFLGGAFFSAVAKTVFTSSIGIALHKFAPSIDPNLVINTGVTEISKVVPPDQLTNALLAYNEALNHVFYLQLAAACCAFASGWGMGWRNLKDVKQEHDDAVARDDVGLAAVRSNLQEKV